MKSEHHNQGELQSDCGGLRRGWSGGVIHSGCQSLSSNKRTNVLYKRSSPTSEPSKSSHHRVASKLKKIKLPEFYLFSELETLNFYELHSLSTGSGEKKKKTPNVIENLIWHSKENVHVTEVKGQTIAIITYVL